MSYHLTAIILAYIIDRIVGDPHNWPHPVKGFGKIIDFFDMRWNKGNHQRLKGLLMLIILVVFVFSLSFFIIILLYQFNPIIGMLVEAILISTTLAQKGLKDAAITIVGPLQNKDLLEARERLSYIVGRDTENMSEQEVVRATIETVAENTSDGITVPLFWCLIGGAPLALVYKAINTCDSMVGYKNDRYQQFGWASAKLDDIVNWIPARLTAVIMMFVMKPKNETVTSAWSILFRDAKKHASPNSGWGEAAVAAILGIQLGGVNYYKGEKSVSLKMGPSSPDRLQIDHIFKTITIMERTVLLFLLLIILAGIAMVLIPL